MDIDEVDKGEERGSLGSTVSAAYGEEDGEEDSPLDEASWVCLNFSKSDWSSSIFDNSLAIVSPGGDCEGGWPERGCMVWGEEGLDLALDWACCDWKCTSILF